MSEAQKCQHVRSNGTQCGSPALKDNSFCYYHQRCRPVTFTYGRYVSDYGRREITLPAFEDAHSIQLTLHRVTELVLRHQIEDKDARMVLFALQLATFNLKHIERDQPKPEDVVTDPPVEPPTENEDEEWLRRKAAARAELEVSSPSDPKPAKESDDNDLPPGTIHACIDATRASHVAHRSSPASRCATQPFFSVERPGQNTRPPHPWKSGPSVPRNSPHLNQGFSPCSPDNAESRFFGFARSPNIQRERTDNSRLPGPKTKLAPN